MQRWLRIGLLASASGLLSLPALLVGPAAGASPRPPSMAAQLAPSSAAILVDADTGRVLYEENAHTALPPGSLTKTLTAMIAAGWLPSGARVPVTADAFNAYPDKVGMKPGQKWSLSVTLHALLTDSANDAAYALAIDIGGSLQGFTKVMQDAGRQIGMSDQPVLDDPAGLDGSEGVNGGNRISAWDLAIMGRDMMANPQLAAIAAQRTYDFEGPDRIAYHIISRNYHFLASFPGAIGIKTGFTNAAGFCSMEEAQKGNRKMIAVVLHSTNPDQVASTLIDAGFSTPTAAEANHPTLPAVVQPGPDPLTPPAPVSAPPATSALKVAEIQTVRPHGGRQMGWIDVAGAFGIVAGIGIWTRRWVKSRQPVPAEVPDRV